MAKRRLERINEVIRRAVAKKIIEDVKDPRVGFTTVTRVETADDLLSANIFVTIFGTEKEQDSTIKILNHMHGFLQSGLGEALRTRVTPVLTFRFDEAASKAVEMENLIKKARSGDTDKVHPEENEDGTEY